MAAGDTNLLGLRIMSIPARMSRDLNSGLAAPIERLRERISAMVRLRNGAVAIVLSASLSGCSFAHYSPFPFAHYSLFHCDSCDDFPTPAYGPDFSLMPGTYTGVGSRDSQPAATSTPNPNSGLPVQAASPAAVPTTPAPSTPPAPPVTSPFERPGSQ
jgi:hypothetical protein